MNAATAGTLAVVQRDQPASIERVPKAKAVCCHEA